MPRPFMIQLLLSALLAGSLSGTEATATPPTLQSAENSDAFGEEPRKQLENLIAHKSSVVIRMSDGGVWAGAPERVDENRLWLSVRETQGSGSVALAWKRIASIASAEGRNVWPLRPAPEPTPNEKSAAPDEKKGRVEDLVILPRPKAVLADAVLPEKGARAPQAMPLEEKVKAAELERKLLVLEAENAILRRSLERERDGDPPVERWLGPLYYPGLSSSYGYYPIYCEHYRTDGIYGYGRRGRGAFYATPGGWGLRYETRRGNTSFALQTGSWSSFYRR